MPAYSARASAALGQFNDRLSAFMKSVKATHPDAERLPRKTLDDLSKIAIRASSAAEAISQSLKLIDITALDVVDMQVRLQGETAKLASALRDLGKRVERQPAVRDTFSPALIPLDEAAQMVAAAIFPSAVQGLRAVNVKLWDFEKLLWMRYTATLTEAVQRGDIPSEHEEKIQEIADDVWAAFAEVNTVLNDLAEARPSDSARLRQRLEAAPARLTQALSHANERLDAAKSDALDRFRPIIKDSKKVADDVAELLRKLTIPVFPMHAALGPCCEFVDATLYDSLSGVQAFALLNILARMQATTAGGHPLLQGRNVKVTHVFPDRIYLEADRSIIDVLGSDTKTFTKAPATLHRFKDGSFKQTTFAKGNLQVTFEHRPNDRVAIDADMDLYRNAIPHLFGEVLVNNLTGSTTDQFKVRSILDEQSILPVEGFELLRV